jgi:6-pyruvoyltetrahydropterin/6-carboxytetrahydropterin synthase
MFITKKFTFDAAHYLPSYNGKCEHLHGHTYALNIKVQGEPDTEGLVIDFAKLKKLVQELVLSKLDHALLNDIMPNPSAENICSGCGKSFISIWKDPTISFMR